MAHIGTYSARQLRVFHLQARSSTTLQAIRQTTATPTGRTNAKQSVPKQQPAYSTAPEVSVVPRPSGVTDGPWDARDEKAVQEAVQQDNARPGRRQVGRPGALLARTIEELRKLAETDGQPGYRGNQLHGGLLRGAQTLDDITDLPKAWREKMAERGVSPGRSHLLKTVTALDGTRKFLLRLHDDRVVEAVGIPSEEQGKSRLTVCVSSQVGCPMRCTFCATGKGGFARNLAAHEIVDQVMTAQEKFGRRVSNVVFMGMGEPLLNLPNVLKSVDWLNQDLGIGARHMTISTVGVPNAIAKLAQHQMQVTLAVSLHAPDQQLRQKLVPSAKAYPLQALMEDSREFFRVTGRRVTFEYTLMAGVNDSQLQAEELAKLLRQYDLCSHVNLIPWNPVDESEFQRPSRNAARAFLGILQQRGIPSSIRITRGLEAAAACGQLRNEHQKMPMQDVQPALA